MEGENIQPEACVELGTLLARGLPEGLPRHTPIDVLFECTQDGRLNVSARLTTLDKSVETQIARTMGMTDEAIEQARSRLLSLIIQ
jgi:molecular chaperone DnaK (HSP70)